MKAVQPSANDGQPGISPWLAGLMLRRGGGALSRFALFCQRLVALPRPRRRLLQRKLSTGLAAAALLLALTGPTAYLGASPDSPAAAIQVVDGEVEIAANGKCSLIEAILNAEATNAGQLHADCAAANLSGADTIQLPTDGYFYANEAYDAYSNALPPISGQVVIEGNGSTINGSYNGAILNVLATGDLTLRDATLRYGGQTYYGVLLNAGNATIENCAFTDNTTNIVNSGTLVIRDTSISGYWSGNRSDQIVNSGSMTLIGSEISAKDLYMRTIYNTGEMFISNSTLSNNMARSYAVIDNTGHMVIDNSTLTGNAAYLSHPIWNSGTLELNRSIISGNSAWEVRCSDDGSWDWWSCDSESVYWYYWEQNISNNEYGGGTVVANNFNLIGANGDAAVYGFTPGPRDVVPSVAIEKILEPAAFNGGPTLTYSLPPGSPAIDLAPSKDCLADPVSGVDQRGLPRNYNGRGKVTTHECDAGALEYQRLNVCPADDPHVAAAFTTLLGSGMNSTTTPVNKNLTIPNAANLVSLYAQYAGKDFGLLPTQVMFKTAKESITQTSPLSPAYRRGAIYWFGTPLQTPIPSVRLSVWDQFTQADQRTPRAFLLYATHRKPADYFDYVERPADSRNNHVYWDEANGWKSWQSFRIDFPALIEPRDITLQVALVDNDKDDRPIYLHVSVDRISPYVQETVASNSYTLTGPNKGNILNIQTVKFDDVPLGANSVYIGVSSPLGNGDSVALVGYTLHYVCEE